MLPEAQTSKRHGSYDRSVHVNVNFVVMLTMILQDIYVPAEFKNPDTSINAVSLEQYDEGYIRPIVEF